MTLTQAADRLGLSASTLRNQIHAGKLRGKLIGKTWTITAGEVRRYERESLGRPGRHADNPRTS